MRTVVYSFFIICLTAWLLTSWVLAGYSSEKACKAP